MIVWRIDRAQHAAAALQGEGARRFGGRWNPTGVPMVYASTSLALAAFETLTRARQVERHLALRAIGIDIAEGTTCDRPEPLPRDWRSPAPGTGTARWGQQWIRQGGFVASVPSVLLPLDQWQVHGEHNLLINPAHPGAATLRIVSSQAFAFDERAWGT